MHTHRKLLVYGLNALLEKDLISLDPSVGVKDGYIETQIAGKSSIVIWRGISGEEVELSVWWDYDHSKHPQANLLGRARENFHGPTPLAKPQKYQEFVGAFASGWVERRTAAFIQGKGPDLAEKYTRRTNVEALRDLPTPIPRGFKAEGKFFA